MFGRRGKAIVLACLAVAIAVAAVVLLRHDRTRPAPTEMASASVAAPERAGPPIRMRLPAGRAVVTAPSATCRETADPKGSAALRLGRGDLLDTHDRARGWTRLKEGGFDCWLPDQLLQFG